MNSKTKQVKLTIDGKEITAEESLTILEAARAGGIDIPTLCHHPALSNWGGCRLCVVEVDKSPRLVASCVMPVRNGMEVVTQSPAITASRRLSLELLFAERNHNCMFCPDSGDCELQKMAYQLQMDHLTVSQSFQEFPTDVTGEYMAFDHNRCILCGRCVRSCAEIAGAHVLGFHNRGPKSMIGFDLLQNRADSACLNCGACLQVCPTGAISNRYRTHLAVKGQSAKKRFISSYCASCSLQCPVRAVTRDNQLIRMEGVLDHANGRPDHGQLCYQGRFEVLKTHGQRLTAPMVKDEKGQWRTESWERAVEVISHAFDAAQAKNGGGLCGLASSRSSNEALALFRELMVDGWSAGIDSLDGDHYRTLLSVQGNGRRSLPPEISWYKIGGADMILLVGADPQSTHPMLVSLLRQAYLAKKNIAVIGQARDTHLFAAYSIAVADKDLPAAISAFGLQLQNDPPRAAGRQALKAEQRAVLNQIAQAFAAAAAPLVLIGEQLTGAAAAGGLAELLAIVKKAHGARSSLCILKPSVNSAAAWGLGVAARQAGSDARGAALLLLSGEQGESLSGLNSLAQAKFLAVITPYYDPAVAAAARVLLPNPLWPEEEGTFTTPDGAGRNLTNRVLDPPAGVLPTWEILQRLIVRKGGADQARNWETIRADAEKLLQAGSN